MATPPETVETPIPAEGGNRTRQIALLTGGLVLVILLLWFFVFRGGGEPTVESVAPPVPAETPLPDETTSEDEEGRVETFEVFAPRDPFEPLVSQGGGGEEGEEEPDDTGTPADGDGAGADGTDGSGESIGGHRVRVVDVFPNGRTAQVQIDGTVYTVDEGERFADNFELIAASGRCATMLFGDDEFTLCEGEEILK